MLSDTAPDKTFLYDINYPDRSILYNIRNYGDIVYLLYLK